MMIQLLLLISCTVVVVINGFTVSTTTVTFRSSRNSLIQTNRGVSILYNTVGNENDATTTTTSTSAFVPLDAADNSDDDDDEDDDDDLLDKVEMLGKGAAKAKRGKRKGGSSTTSKTPLVKAALVPEETYYEGPPALSETFIPTLSIITVVGIIPAIASWARQAWVRYKITNRRIRVNSGIGGNDMAEIIYNDIVEIRTVKRLFGDGDMVCYLRDGAKFEMRNIPEFDTAIEFILSQCDPDVVAQYRNKGDVGRN